MQNFPLATLLFVVYFSLVCCFLYEPTQSKILSANQASARTPSYTHQPPSSEPITKELMYSTTSTTLVEKVFDVVETSHSQSSDPWREIAINGINLDKLPLRKARKIASRLGIKQKINGVDQRVTYFRHQIKRALREQPREVASIIAEVLTTT